MDAKLARGLVTCLAWSLLVGCSSSAGTFRCQSPASYAALPAPRAIAPQRIVRPPTGFLRQPPMTVRAATGLPLGPIVPVQATSPAAQYAGMSGYAHSYHSGTSSHHQQRACYGCQTGQCGPNRPHWMPTHHHWSVYRQPSNLSYPPSQVPAAVTQYPYYTLKGPSDFFLK